MKSEKLLALFFAVSVVPPALAQVVRVDGQIWGGNVAGGSWYLRDTPSYTGQPCYYIESSRANWGWGGASSVYGGSVTRGNTRGDNGQQGSGQATSGFRDVLTITAPGVPVGTSGSVTFNIAIATQYTPTLTFNPAWHHLAGTIGLAIGTGQFSSDIYSWGAYVYPGGLFADYFETAPAAAIPPSVQVTYPFQFGVSFPISIYGSAHTTAEGSPPPEYFELYLQNSISWGGVAALFGPGGAVTVYSIESASGTDYTGSQSVCGSNCGGLPAISGPNNASACATGQATFTVTPQTAQQLAYQWQIQITPNTWVNLSSGPVPLPCGGSAQATSPHSATSSIGITPCPGVFAYQVRCVVTSACASVASDPATYTVCYSNCDCSAVAPILTANDFQCFLNKYASGDPYANCDGSTGSPLLTANDFQCFLNAYAMGCP